MTSTPPPLVKAFLSHSSKDRELVTAVATRLTQLYCHRDVQSFDTGVDFKTSIERYLDESCVFVLFASRQSLLSDWVHFEVEEAWYRKLRDKLDSCLVYLIDSSVDVSDLPEWLRRGRIDRGTGPQHIARDIRFHLDEILARRRPNFFVNRNRESDRLTRSLVPTDGSIPSRVIFITGLPGIGRRWFLKHSVPRLLPYPKQVEIRVSEGDAVTDLCLKIADAVEPHSTLGGLQRLAS
jgi:TIR domain